MSQKQHISQTYYIICDITGGLYLISIWIWWNLDLSHVAGWELDVLDTWLNVKANRIWVCSTTERRLKFVSCWQVNCLLVASILPSKIQEYPLSRIQGLQEYMDTHQLRILSCFKQHRWRWVQARFQSPLCSTQQSVLDFMINLFSGILVLAKRPE